MICLDLAYDILSKLYPFSTKDIVEIVYFLLFVK